MGKHSLVDQEFYRLENWSDKDRDELKKRLFGLGLDEQKKIREQAEIESLMLGVDKQEFEKRFKEGDSVQGIETGYWSLDRMTAGLVQGELTIIGAPTAVGKTNLVVNMMSRQALLGIKCLIISLENTKESIRKRMRAIMGEEYFYDGVSLNNVFVQKFPRFEYQSLSYAVKEAKRLGVQVIYIDHLQFFIRGMRNPAEELGIITKEIKTVATEEEIPIVLVSQLRRLEQGERPDEHSLRGSAFIEQDADCVLILDKDKEDFQPHIRIRLCKKRDRLLWKPYSEIKFSQIGYDLEEGEYNEAIDIANDCWGKPRGRGSSDLNFRETTL